MTERLTRGVLARQSGVNAETIRYYERIGLLPDPPRSDGGHRLYGEAHQRRLGFIHKCRQLGFTLEEIRELLSLVDREQVSCERVQHIAEQHLASIRARIRDLRRMQRSLTELVEQCSGDDVPECPIIDALHGKWGHA